MPEPFLLNSCIFINQGHFCKRLRQDFAMVTEYDVKIDIKWRVLGILVSRPFSWDITIQLNNGKLSVELIILTKCCLNTKSHHVNGEW